MLKTNLHELKIAIVSPNSPPSSSGGITSAHYNLYCAMKENGFNVTMFTFADNKKIKKASEKEIRRFGTPKIILKFIDIIFFFIRFFSHKELNKLRYVIRSQFGALRASTALQKYKPDIIIVPDRGSPLFSIRKPKKSKIIFISHHNQVRFINEPLLGRHSRKEAMLINKIERNTLKKADAAVCPSNYMKNVFLNSYQFNNIVKVIPNVINEKTIESVASFALREKFELQPDAPVIYIPSAGSVYKGSNYVFEIIRRLSYSSGRKIGFYLSGYINALLARELSFLKSDAVVFAPGQTSYFDNISYIKACSFCISPTLIENFGMAILEANFCGLPAITFDVGGNADIIKNGYNGYLIDLLDIENLIKKSQELLENNELLNQMKYNSSKIVMNNFSSNAVIECYKKFIEQVITPCLS
jgi:glycosyltransferase involved in cell wall biosynthesis